MEQQHRCPVAHLGDMQPDPLTLASDIHPEVIDTRQGREPIESRRRGRNRHDDNLSPRHYGAKHPTLSHDRFHPFPGSSELSMGGRSSVWSPSVCSEHDPQPIVIKVFEAVG